MKCLNGFDSGIDRDRKAVTNRNLRDLTKRAFVQCKLTRCLADIENMRNAKKLKCRKESIGRKPSLPYVFGDLKQKQLHELELDNARVNRADLVM